MLTFKIASLESRGRAISALKVCKEHLCGSRDTRIRSLKECFAKISPVQWIAPAQCAGRSLDAQIPIRKKLHCCESLVTMVYSIHCDLLMLTKQTGSELLKQASSDKSNKQTSSELLEPSDPSTLILTPE